MVAMAGTCAPSAAETSNEPTAMKNATANRRTMGSYAMTWIVSRAAPISA